MVAWAEFCYNSSYQASIRTSPFQVVYGKDPLSLRSYTPGEACLPAVHNQLMERDEFIAEIHDCLKQAQQHYKQFYDQKHKEVEFVVGQWVWLRLLHRPIASLDVKGRDKLGPKFYGPFQIVEGIGDVAYRLKLSPGAKLHDVFHVGLLKRFCGEPPSETVALPPMRHGRACAEPASVLKGRLAHCKRKILVTWKGQAAVNATWMNVDEFRALYPTFKLADGLVLRRG
jgi:hypothetical protein